MRRLLRTRGAYRELLAMFVEEILLEAKAPGRPRADSFSRLVGLLEAA